MTDFAALLKNSNLKATIQRINILEIINDSGHISIEKIYEEIIKKTPLYP